jgi:hypothetical protein
MLKGKDHVVAGFGFLVPGFETEQKFLPASDL